MPKITMKRRVFVALQKKDWPELNNLVNIMRQSWGMTSRDIFEYFKMVDPAIDAARFDELMRKCDREDSR